MIFRLFEWKSSFELSRLIWTKWLPICCTWVEIVLKMRGKTHNRIETKIAQIRGVWNKLVRNNFKHKTIAKNVIKFFCYFCLWYYFVWVFFQILNFAMLFFIYSFLFYAHVIINIKATNWKMSGYRDGFPFNSANDYL